MKKRVVLAVISAVFMIFAACAPTPSSGAGNSSSLDETGDSTVEMPQPEKVLAHWKFQNLEGCYQGDIETDELTFFDLSGNGNDLISVFEGNGHELDVFTWDTGVTGENSSSLKFNNTLELAESVDPYNKSQTTYSGAYVSGKYLKTKASAPMNFIENTREWTIEIVFKISSEWNNSY